MNDNSVQVKFTRSLKPKENLTIGKMYNVLSMTEKGSENIVGVNTPESMEFTIENDVGKLSKLRMCNVDVYLGGELLD
ncbi:hypothetical protein [Pseudoalteromonas phage PH357]|nr:hypothetical protein [Pseudoalteromonas phage PH357]